MEKDIGNIILQATSAAYFTKILVDSYKKSPIPSPAWATLPLVFLVGNGISFLLALYMKVVFDGSTIAGTILVGIVASGAAIGTTELQRSMEHKPKDGEENSGK